MSHNDGKQPEDERQSHGHPGGCHCPGRCRECKCGLRSDLAPAPPAKPGA